jgi:calcineurin-like phosphoesterase
VLEHARRFVPLPFEVSDGDIRLGGAIAEIDAATGRATSIRRVMLSENEIQSPP